MYFFLELFSRILNVGGGGNISSLTIEALGIMSKNIVLRGGEIKAVFDTIPYGQIAGVVVAEVAELYSEDLETKTSQIMKTTSEY